MSDNQIASQPNNPEPERTEPMDQSSTNPTEVLMYKNRLQQYAQKSSLPLPKYQTACEGSSNCLRFRSTVLVDGSYYTSPNVFLSRKAAEQDVARVALDEISQKIKNGGCPLIRELIIQDTIFCKSILNEYADKMNMEKPTYTTIPVEGGLVRLFVSSLVFNGVQYTGNAAKNKKEAEQLTARVAIQSIMGDPTSGTTMSAIIKSKLKFYVALDKVKDVSTTHNGVMPPVINAGSSYGVPLDTGKEVRAAQGAIDVPSTVVSDICSGEYTNVTSLSPHLHQFKKPRTELTSESIAPPIVFVPPVSQSPSVLGSTPGSKRKNKNKKAKKKMPVDPQLPVAAVPLSQGPSCSVAQ